MSDKFPTPELCGVDRENCYMAGIMEALGEACYAAGADADEVVSGDAGRCVDGCMLTEIEVVIRSTNQLFGRPNRSGMATQEVPGGADGVDTAD